MPTPMPPGFRLGLAEPQDAIAAFQRRELLQPSFRWQDVFDEEHGRAFAVAGVSRLDVLQVVQDELALSLAEGRSLADFRSRIRPALVSKGFWGDLEVQDPTTGERRVTRFDDARLKTIFDVNMRQSQAAGRWARIERSRDTLPLLLYRTAQDERVRASHRAWNGVCLPIDHPFWATHYPPNGWRCRCRVFAVNERDLERRRARGEVIKTEAPPEQVITYVNPRTGEVVPVPRGIDPGFAYNPGKLRDAELHEQLLRKALKSSPLEAATVLAQATADHALMVRQATQRFGEFVDEVLASGKARGQMQYVGGIKPAPLRALSDRGLEPTSAAIAVRDLDVLHALRPGKAGTAAALPEGVYRRLPELLARADAMLLELGDAPALLYVVDLVREDGSVAKLVLQLDKPVKKDRQALQANVVRTATVMDPNALQDRTRYELLWGQL